MAAAPAPSEASAGSCDSVSWLDDHLRRRVWPLVVAVVFLAVTMLYSFAWNPLVHHVSVWVVPGDIWSTFRSAHWVGWGDLGGVYGSDSQLVSFPGIAVLLAPVAMLSGHFGLSESIAPIFLSHPTAWLLLGPAICLLGTTSLFAIDAVAEYLGASRAVRILLCWMEAVLFFQVIAIWGHPEDLVALALALYALLAGFKGNWRLSGWLWGLAIVMQPLVVLMFPLALAQTAMGRKLRFCACAVVPSLVLVGTPLVAQWKQTSTVLFHQANFEFLDHATPWVALSPHLTRISVGAGPGRLIAVVAAALLGLIAWRRSPSPLGILWLCAMALSLRCFFEAVMVPFYLGPPLAVIVLTASLRPYRWKLLLAWALAMSTTVLSFYRLSEWIYWSPMVVLLALGLACGWPGRTALGAIPSSRYEAEVEDRILRSETLGVSGRLTVS